MKAQSGTSPYQPDDFDEFLALKPSLTMWLVVVFAMHPALFIFLGMLPKGGDNFLFLRDFLDVNSLISAVPAVIVAATFLRRRPDASRIVRQIWRHGRWFLVTALAIGVYAQASNVFGSGISSDGPPPETLLVLNVIAICFVLTSPRVRDVFADFPEPSAAKSAVSS